MNPLITVITPTTVTAQLADAVRSVDNQTYKNIQHLIVVDGVEHYENALDSIVRSRYASVLTLPYNTGHSQYNGHRIYGAMTFIAEGEYLCFLNNDTEVISRNWLKSMVEHASRGNTGLVGALLSYPNGSIQHMGIALGHTGIAGHPYRGESKDQCVPETCFEVSAVTFACAMISASKFWEIGALDESFPSGFNDVDISIRSLNHNYKNLVCVKAQLIHHEAQTRPKSLSFKGFTQAANDVVLILRNNRGNPKEIFFSANNVLRTRRDRRREA